MNSYLRGLKAGIPIGLGYLSVSFTFGIMAVSYGLYWWQAMLISMTTVTSAGQFAGIGTMLLPGRYLEMLVSQLTINIRYSFMSVALSQKTAPQFRGIYRWILGFMMTDEIFAVASTEDSITRSYFAGLSTIPYLGWTFGTLIGALLGNVLPAQAMSALSLAIYGMFVAIVIPGMKKETSICLVVFLAIIFSCIFRYLPGFNQISQGFSISISAILAAGAGTVFSHLFKGTYNE